METTGDSSEWISNPPSIPECAILQLLSFIKENGEKVNINLLTDGNLLFGGAVAEVGAFSRKALLLSNGIFRHSQESGGIWRPGFATLVTVTQYDQIESIIQHLGEHFKDQPTLEELAERTGLTPDHFQRVFKRWVGISPKQFLKYLTLEYAKSRLEQSQSVLDTALDSGLSGPGRLHDLFVTMESITPGEYKRGGEGLSIRYGYHETPFGWALLAACDRGLCGSFFIPRPSERLAEEAILEYWPHARIEMDGTKTKAYADSFFHSGANTGQRLSVYVRGTPFQVQVWRALLEIPSGSLCTYSNIAAAIGRPSATRAVAGAVGDNPISWLIPCHRVIRKGGYLGGYRWGLPRKKVMLAWEASRENGQ